MARVGIPALLALAAVLAVAQPWRSDETARPAGGVAAVRGPARAVGVAPAPARPAAAARDAELGADDRLAISRPEPVDAGAPASMPTPTGMDIPSAVAAGHAEAERLRAGQPTASMLADRNATETPMRSDVAPTAAGVMADGPEAGALYWFGPQGLVKLSTTGEGQR